MGEFATGSFQNYLVDVLYDLEQKKPVYKPYESDPLEDLLQRVTCNMDEHVLDISAIAGIYWHMPDRPALPAGGPPEVSQLFQLHHLIEQTIEHHLDMTHKWLCLQGDGLDLLYYYTVKWGVYTNSIHELE